MQCVYIIISLISLASIAWVSFSIPMLACDAPLWSGCLSLLPGIVFDTHHSEPAPLHYAGIVFDTYGYLMPPPMPGIVFDTQDYVVVFYSCFSCCRVLFSIPIILSLLLSSPLRRYRKRDLCASELQ